MANACWSVAFREVLGPLAVVALGLEGLLTAACGGTTVGPSPGSPGGAGSISGAGNAGATAGGSAGAAAGGSGGSSTFSPDSCKAAGGDPVPSKGSKQTPETDCDNGIALGVIDAASSGWDEGGLCCAVRVDPVPPSARCGARAGDTCTSDEFCAYTAGQLCGQADASSECKQRPRECIELYAPVCGCDHETYDNSCYANAAGTGIYAASACVN